jgi:subtilase family serine protease
MFAAQGDAGAYEANRAAGAAVLAGDRVGSPASSPWITSAGTTLPGTMVFSVAGKLFPITIESDRRGMVYLHPLCERSGSTTSTAASGVWAPAA